MSYIIGDINVVSLYEDPYIDDDKIRQVSNKNKSFLICSTKIANILKQVFLRKERKQKLDYINVNIRSSFCQK